MDKSNNRLNILIIIMILEFLILIITLSNVQIINHKSYLKKYSLLSNVIVDGETPPRGRIYDRNDKLIVDNKPVRTIFYKRKGDVDEVKLAYELSNILEIDYTSITDEIKKDFWLKIHKKEASEKTSKKDLLDLKYHKISTSELDKKIKEKITEEELNKMTENEKETAYIYYLMHNNYSYLDKIIKNKDINDSEVASIANLKNKGIDVKLDWERNYLYNDTFRSILGSVSKLPKELKNNYIKKGYNLNDRVGTSYLEYQYDNYLKGKKSKYKLNNDNSLTIVEEGKKGKDIKITIDIELQKEVEKIIEEEMIKAKSEPNTKFFNKAFAIISDPTTGEILAMSGKQIYNEDGKYSFYDYTPGVFTSSFAVGSVIKGASHIVGYTTGALKIGEIRYDNCVKLKSAPSKCSWKYLGRLDDLKALKLSSNTFQFYTAFNVANTKYYYDMPFSLNNDAFKIYRDMFHQFGLGVKSGIDLPKESDGLKGKNDSAGLLLDFAIGQYDNYTPIQLAQYINTIANNGDRMKMHILKSHNKKDYKNKLLNKVNTDIRYIDRVKEGFKQVLAYGGTGSGYIDLKYKPAGKTGTSQSFADKDLDGNIDTETVTNTFAGYAPYDNPKVSFVVVTPDTYDYGSSYQTSVNKRISKRISEKYFEIYG